MSRAFLLICLACFGACSSFPASFDYRVDEAAGAAGAPVKPDPTCDDHKKNGDETGIDCGMAACNVTCAVGQGCANDMDCDGGKCLRGACQESTCSDELKNQDEADVDCGGVMGCNRCSEGKHCLLTNDCNGGECLSGSCRAASCGDKMKNGDETDVDCGGSCNPCQPGQICAMTTDCDGVLCTKGKCQPASCSDKLLNGDETDVDCGGTCDSACDDGFACQVAADCTSGVCPKTHKCAAPTCEDKVLNGDEPSADCGGSCTTKCQMLDNCTVPADCESATCANKRCIPAGPTGVVLNDPLWVATASHETKMSPPSFGIDGSQMTYWITGAAQTRGMWFQIDMLTEQAVLSIDIDNNDAPDTATAIDVSFSNAETFATAVTPVKNRALSAIDTIAFNQAQVGRYLRITIATANSSRWWRVDEIRVKQ